MPAKNDAALAAGSAELDDDSVRAYLKEHADFLQFTYRELWLAAGAQHDDAEAVAVDGEARCTSTIWSARELESFPIF